MSQSWKNLAVLFVLFVLIAFMGCSSKPVPIPIPEKSQGEGLVRIFTAYEQAAEKLERPPQSAEDIKPFLEPHGNPDALLLSPNDGEPYVILWGVDLARKKPKPDYLTSPVLAHEKTGKQGIRQVVDIFGDVRSVDAGEFARITFAPGSTTN
ncbi:MAG: hypothetical protein AB7K24_20150 [Gemmataceae bacterium]